MRRLALLAFLFTASLSSQSSVDTATLAKIKSEGLERSQAQAIFDTLTTDIGPRLTASPAHVRAAEFVRERLAAYGLDNARLEPWTFPRGWVLDKLTIELVEPRYLPLIGYADAWSPSMRGEVVGTPVITAGKSADELDAMRDRLAGAIIMTLPMMTNFVRRDRPQPSDPDYVPGSAAYATSAGRGRGTAPARPAAAPRLAPAVRDAAVMLHPSTGEHGTVFVTGRDTPGDALPSIALSGEHYNMIVRMLDRHLPVKLRIDLKSRYVDNGGRAFNVLAEIPGVDPSVRDEVVMLGAHLDSWHTGVGATDNADGVTTVMEAVRILTAIGARPRRTIRIALWGGEEQGLLGSKAWVDAHLAGDANRAARDAFDVYFNIDNGTGPIYGWYLENNTAVQPIFDAWLAPLKDVGGRRNVIEPVGSTDHVSFNAAGVPGFNPIQSYVDYDTRTHHTNMDTPERLKVDEIKQAAVVMASFVYDAAMADRKIPRTAAAAPSGAAR